MVLQQLDLASAVQPKPVVKWAGGKQQLLEVLLAKAPRHYGRYVEPFVGGGALFFALLPERAVISDSNPELINLYRVIASDVESLIEALRPLRNDEETFYRMRALCPSELCSVEQAARTLYLNRTCYNGLFRVNRRGQFNVPFGRYKNPVICDAENLSAASFALRRAEIILGDFRSVLRDCAQPGDFVYLDPPYLPISTYSDFKRYTKEQFYVEDHRDLADEVRRLHDLGCYVLLTNSNHPLVHELYGDFHLEVHQTRRNISTNASTRRGEDVLVEVLPKRRLAPVPSPAKLPAQAAKFPRTRYMGSKQDLLGYIAAVAGQFEYSTVLDLFAGSGVVSYMFKALGKQVITNDYMAFCATLAKALIQNAAIRLSKEDIAVLCDEAGPTDDFVVRTFSGLYFDDPDTAFIDIVRGNLKQLGSDVKRALALSALIRACLKKRPRGIFTFTGHRYDDGRRDLTVSLRQHFVDAVGQINKAVFDNGCENQALNCDAMEVHHKADLVYIDPPYFSPLSDNEYVRRYHFLEGLARDWQGVQIQWHTKTRKFKSYPTPFGTRTGAHDAFDMLFRRHKQSILIVSYSSNSLPTMDEMLGLLARHKRHVEVVTLNHRYSFGNQGHKVGNQNNRVQEYLFVGY